jgi:uncharacterized protein (TIGR02421 family)
MSQPQSKKVKDEGVIPDALIEIITERLADGKRVRRRLPGKGRINVDRPLPFLCIYRFPTDREDRGTAHFVIGEGSYLIAQSDEAGEKNLSLLVENVVKVLADKFGAFLIIEVWSAKDSGEENAAAYFFKPKAKFRIFTAKSEETPSTVEVLSKALESLNIPGFKNAVEIKEGGIASPPKMTSLLTTSATKNISCLMIGLEVPLIYRDAETGEIYPTILRLLHRKLSQAFQQAFFDFAHVQTSQKPDYPQTLGRRAMVKATWNADAELSALNETFNYLLAVTPVNTEQAFAEFKESKFESEPVFHYRLLAVDPEDLKRRLYGISFERIEDPTMAYLLRDKRIELDRQISLIEDRDTPRFLYGSLQLFPPVEDDLMRIAESIFELESAENADSIEKLDAAEVATRARAEIEYYQNVYPEITAEVQIRDDIPPGLMVSQGNLLIGQRTSISASRIDALLQHEVGTHIVTYFNGRAQPLRQLYSGLPNYEQLQEGLAVLAEYLVGGLNRARLRMLAARVIAVRRLTEGASFIDVFRELHKTYNFAARTSFNVTMRVFRGGGLTKDAVYLRGLIELLNYLAEGNDIEPLFIGKMGAEHVSIICELQWREVLRPAPLAPRYMTFPQTAERLEKLRNGITVLELL